MFNLLFWRVQHRLAAVLDVLTSMLKTSAQLRLENLALRQQLTVLRRSAPKRLQLTRADRIFWVWLRRVWGGWKSVLMIVSRLGTGTDHRPIASCGHSLSNFLNTTLYAVRLATVMFPEELAQSIGPRRLQLLQSGPAQ